MKKDYLEEGAMADTADLVVLGAYYGTGNKGEWSVYIIERFSLDCRIGIGFGFGFGLTTSFGWLVYLLWFWFYDSQVKTALSCKYED